MEKKINFNGFLKKAVEESPKEVCAFLFSKKPYSDKEEWFCFPIQNIDPHPEEGWMPDKKETQKIKQEARKLGLVKIGNIHTHPIPKSFHSCIGEDFIEENFKPSERDLKFAQKYGDIVRGIIVVDSEAIYGIKFHDMFGNNLNISVMDKEKELKSEGRNSPHI